MPYYIRILSPEARPVEPQTLSTVVAGLGSSLSGDTDTKEWHQLEVISASGEAPFLIERNEMYEGSLAEQEIAEFQQEIADCLPKSGVEWLRAYLPSVKTIYAFQVLDAVYADNGWAVLYAVRDAILNAAGGIIQADGEGFSNEDGYHILWQFSDSVSGEWWVAILQNGEWQKFKIELGNRSHRLAFKSGEIPPGVERA